jgi:hypothetical protein
MKVARAGLTMQMEACRKPCALRRRSVQHKNNYEPTASLITMTGKRKSTSYLSRETADAPLASNKRIELEELVLVLPKKEEEVSDLESDDEDDADDLPRLDGDEDVRKVLPEGFTPETHPHIISQMIDEVVILMKEVRDFIIYEGRSIKRMPKNLLKNQLRFMEIEFNLPKGTLKESTVHSRLKSYKLMGKSISLLDQIEADLLLLCLEKVKSSSDEDAVDKILNYRNIFDFAKSLLKVEQQTLSVAQQEKYNLAKDLVKLDEYWLRIFLSRLLAALQKHGLPMDTVTKVRAALDSISRPVAHRNNFVAVAPQRNGDNAAASSSDTQRTKEPIASIRTEDEGVLNSKSDKDHVNCPFDDTDDEQESIGAWHLCPWFCLEALQYFRDHGSFRLNSQSMAASSCSLRYLLSILMYK